VISVVIPVFNEAQAIRPVISRISEVMNRYGSEYEIVVVDDGSGDESVRCIGEFPHVQVLVHPENRGTGAARNTGVQNARGDFILMIDGDGTYAPEDIPLLLAEIGRADMVVGARSIDFGSFRLFRIAVKFILRKIACFFTACSIPDLNSGLRLMRKEAVLPHLHLLPSTHSWVSTITLVMLYNGYRVLFVPVQYRPRIGNSTFHPVIDTGNMCKAIFKTTWIFRRVKLIAVAAAFAFLFALIDHVIAFFLAFGVSF
jgi:glycosyltransferase involved in cell wall biosynthesis